MLELVIALSKFFSVSEYKFHGCFQIRQSLCGENSGGG